LNNDLSVNRSRPTFVKSILGLISTFVNVYTIQGGYWSITAAITLGMTVYITSVTMILYILYAVRSEPVWEDNYAINRPNAA
jgi:hypothetical protein